MTARPSGSILERRHLAFSMSGHGSQHNKKSWEKWKKQMIVGGRSDGKYLWIFGNKRGKRTVCRGGVVASLVAPKYPVLIDFPLN